MNKNTIIGIIISILVLGGIIFFARPSPSGKEQANVVSGQGKLVLEKTDYDFGSVSMASGKVSSLLKIKNQGADPAVVRKIYTSCMCTEATLKKDGVDFGPFGMAGHGFVPRINQTIAPGEEAELRVEFDPAAHGPAGVGPVEREVYVETDGGDVLKYYFKALVTP